MAFEKINHSIIGKTNIISGKENENWNLEANIVSWYEKKPKLDIRNWSADHLKMSKGLCLSKEETIKLRDTLVSMNIEEINF